MSDRIIKVSELVKWVEENTTLAGSYISNGRLFKYIQENSKKCECVKGYCINCEYNNDEDNYYCTLAGMERGIHSYCSEFEPKEEEESNG